MKIIILGIKTTVLDEGAKNVATNLSAALSEFADTLIIHQRKALSLPFLRKARAFRPDLILSIHGPSPKTVGLLFILKLLLPGSRVAIIGTQPQGGNRLLRLMKILKPDIVFAQSNYWKKRFLPVSKAVYLLPNGVDHDKFRPACDRESIRKLKTGFGFSPEDRVVLHVGPVNHNRNLDIFINLQRDTDWKVLVVGSTTAPYVQALAQKLLEGGIRLHSKYVQGINALYSMADVYVFPVMNPGGSIEIPLTVIEAMACDTPVVTTRFRGLPDVLPDAPALAYFESYAELDNALNRVSGISGNQEATKHLGWKNIARQLIETVQP